VDLTLDESPKETETKTSRVFGNHTQLEEKQKSTNKVQKNLQEMRLIVGDAHSDAMLLKFLKNAEYDVSVAINRILDSPSLMSDSGPPRTPSKAVPDKSSSDQRKRKESTSRKEKKKEKEKSKKPKKSNSQKEKAKKSPQKTNGETESPKKKPKTEVTNGYSPVKNKENQTKTNPRDSKENDKKRKPTAGKRKEMEKQSNVKEIKEKESPPKKKIKKKSKETEKHKPPTWPRKLLGTLNATCMSTTMGEDLLKAGDAVEFRISTPGVSQKSSQKKGRGFASTKAKKEKRFFRFVKSGTDKRSLELGTVPKHVADCLFPLFERQLIQVEGVCLMCPKKC